MKKQKYLVVTTAHKGVFAGYGQPTTNAWAKCFTEWRTNYDH